MSSGTSKTARQAFSQIRLRSFQQRLIKTLTGTPRWP